MSTPDINSVASILRESGLQFEVGDGASPVAAQLRHLPYLEQWRLMTKNGWFRYRLEDHSLLWMDAGANPSYHYLPSPIDALSLRAFGAERGLFGSALYSATVRNEYDLYLDTAPARAHVTPIRFDTDLNGFSHECHPLAHIHFGFESNVRIGTRRHWNAVAFSLFVIRQCYPDNWRVLLTRPSAAALERRVRRSLREVALSHWSSAPLREVYLF